MTENQLITGIDGLTSGSRKRNPEEVLAAMILSRECDRRESILVRQGRGHFHMSGAGHETTAVLADFLEPEDYVYPHYRDRALLLALGAPLSEMALSYFAKSDSSSAGRQMPNHFCFKERNVVAAASPVGLQFLPAAGTAWASRLAQKNSVTICLTGEGAIRQGEFFEAWCFALQEKLPLVFVVEDNGYAISTRTDRLNPLRLEVLGSRVIVANGREVDSVCRAASEAIHKARSGEGPSILWLELDRLHPHTSADDHRVYRSEAELRIASQQDPIESFARTRDLSRQVEEAYQSAERAAEPELPAANLASAETYCRSELPSGRSWTLLSAFQHTVRELLASDGRTMLLGEDVEDPKGGVFGLTKGLSTAFPGRVLNAPLAEATIAGLGAGLAIAGLKPIVELQFIDFAGPAFNQIANQIATLRWRSAGQWKCPLVIYAPCGAYLPAGGPWHSQTTEGIFTHIPGLRVAIPSRPDDVAALLRAAVAQDDPVLLLLPKHLLRIPASCSPTAGAAFGQGIVRREGRDVSIVAWGNCVGLALEASEELERAGILAEVIDLRSLVPCDWDLIQASVRRTSRLVVVQEDTRTSSFGQAILSELTSNPTSWDFFAAPPQLVSRGDEHVGYNPILEKAVLPQVGDIVRAVQLTLRY